jgi:hypothetical protein
MLFYFKLAVRFLTVLVSPDPFARTSSQPCVATMYPISLLDLLIAMISSLFQSLPHPFKSVIDQSVWSDRITSSSAPPLGLRLQSELDRVDKVLRSESGDELREFTASHLHELDMTAIKVRRSQ